MLDFIAFKTSHFRILRKLSGGFGHTKGYGVVRSLSINQTAFKEILCYLIVNPMPFLNGIKRNAVVQSQSVIVFEQFGVPLIYGITIYADRNLFLRIVNLIVRHRESTLHLFGKHLFDSPAYRVNHVEMHHSLA